MQYPNIPFEFYEITARDWQRLLRDHRKTNHYHEQALRAFERDSWKCQDESGCERLLKWRGYGYVDGKTGHPHHLHYDDLGKINEHESLVSLCDYHHWLQEFNKNTFLVR